MRSALFVSIKFNQGFKKLETILRNYILKKNFNILFYECIVISHKFLEFLFYQADLRFYVIVILILANIRHHLKISNFGLSNIFFTFIEIYLWLYQKPISPFIILRNNFLGSNNISIFCHN